MAPFDPSKAPYARNETSGEARGEWHPEPDPRASPSDPERMPYSNEEVWDYPFDESQKTGGRSKETPDDEPSDGNVKVTLDPSEVLSKVGDLSSLGVLL